MVESSRIIQVAFHIDGSLRDIYVLPGTSEQIGRSCPPPWSGPLSDCEFSAV